MADYAAKPTKAKEDEAIIDHRKRMLTSFLNRCRRMKDVREDSVFWKFLDPNASWVRRNNGRARLPLTTPIERSSSFASYFVAAKKQPQSTASRPSKSNAWT